MFGTILSNSDLTQLSFQNVRHKDLTCVDFTGSNLESSNFTKMTLRKCIFQCTNVKGAKWVECNLNSAEMAGIDLQGSNLSHANLDHANLTNACLLGAKIEGASFKGTVLIRAQLSDPQMDFKEAILDLPFNYEVFEHVQAE